MANDTSTHEPSKTAITLKLPAELKDQVMDLARSRYRRSFNGQVVFLLEQFVAAEAENEPAEAAAA